MPTYHSQFNETKGDEICKTVVLPLKTKVKGPAPACPDGETDIIDEAIDYFRANVLYRNFQSEGPADLTLAYLTVFISECLRVFAKHSDKKEASKQIVQLAVSGSFAIPGDKGFPLGGFFSEPGNRSESDKFRAYYRQLREETSLRMLDRAYLPDGSVNKWWMQFSKSKFMNITKT